MSAHGQDAPCHLSGRDVREHDATGHNVVEFLAFDTRDSCRRDLHSTILAAGHHSGIPTPGAFELSARAHDDLRRLEVSCFFLAQADFVSWLLFSGKPSGGSQPFGFFLVESLEQTGADDLLAGEFACSAFEAEALQFLGLGLVEFAVLFHGILSW